MTGFEIGTRPLRHMYTSFSLT